MRNSGHFHPSRCSYHVLHVRGGWIDATSQFVVQKKDLLTIWPGYGAAYAWAWCGGRGVGLQLVLVATQQLLELRRVGQEEAGGQTSGQEQQREREQPKHGDGEGDGGGGDGGVGDSGGGAGGDGGDWRLQIKITEIKLKADLKSEQKFCKKKKEPSVKKCNSIKIE